MDTRNSAMVAGVYLVGILIVVLVCWGYYSYERPEVSPSLAGFNEQSGGPVRSNSRPAPLESATYYHAALAKANQSLRDLQVSLASSRDRLEKQSQTIKKKNAECQALKDELDQTFTLILNLLAEDSKEDSTARQSANQAKTKVEAELEQLIASLKQSEVLGSEQKQQLAQLRADLKRTDEQLMTVQEQSELELAAVLAEKKTSETAAIEIIARCGMTAVPILTERLNDERFEVRRFAVKALGAIGPDAQESLAAVRRLLTDPEPSVREEAQRAVDAITE